MQAAQPGLSPNGGAKLTRLSKAISVLLVVAYGASLVPPTSSYLALVPGRTLPCVWNLLTAGFIANSWVELALEIAAVLALARLIEPVYGSKEFLKFILVVDVCTCVSVFFGVYVMYAALQKAELLYTEFKGFYCVVFGMLVAAKQIMPDHELKLLGALKLKMKYVPILALLIGVVISVALKTYMYLPFAVFGFYFGWLYLRFFQQQPDTQYYGDPNDDFKFSGFFPPFLEMPIDACATLLSLVFRLRHAPGAAEAAGAGKAGGMHHHGSGPSLLGSDAADASRRRERGAKALEERLGRTKAPGGVADVEKGAGGAPAQGDDAAAPS